MERSPKLTPILGICFNPSVRSSSSSRAFGACTCSVAGAWKRSSPGIDALGVDGGDPGLRRRPAPEVAVVEPGARAALVRFDSTVTHYEVCGRGHDRPQLMRISLGVLANSI
jgi:hypothetical protein